jgi:hypothetical protein
MFKCHGIEWFEGDKCIECEGNRVRKIDIHHNRWFKPYVKVTVTLRNDRIISRKRIGRRRALNKTFDIVDALNKS